MSNFSLDLFIRSKIIKWFYSYPWGQNWTIQRGFKNSVQIQTEIWNYYSHSAIKPYLSYICTGLILLQLLIKNYLNIEYDVDMYWVDARIDALWKQGCSFKNYFTPLYSPIGKWLWVTSSIIPISALWQRLKCGLSMMFHFLRFDHKPPKAKFEGVGTYLQEQISFPGNFCFKKDGIRQN